jgi:hypothetical protein
MNQRRGGAVMDCGSGRNDRREEGSAFVMPGSTRDPCRNDRKAHAGSGVFGVKSQYGATAHCQHMGLRATHT